MGLAPVLADLLRVLQQDVLEPGASTGREVDTADLVRLRALRQKPAVDEEPVALVLAQDDRGLGRHHSSPRATISAGVSSVCSSATNGRTRVGPRSWRSK